ncbi:MAG: hypothetical protein GX660_22390 [Clostridiaceae bacterium]|jgi:hypothetical protein|nr:hypothetical protein [Clostridiaceae bacterium]
MLYPKPAKKKQKKAKNNPRPGSNDLCAICGKSYAHLHEIYFGKNRQNSIEHKMQIRLCFQCHEGKDGVHNNPVFDFMLKQHYQQKFEQQRSREEFVKIFGKNYLNMSFEEYKKKGVDVA